MRPFLLILSGCLLIAALCAIFLLPDIARGKMEDTLKQAGIYKIEIGKLSLRPFSVTGKNIRFGPYGLNTIDSLTLTLSWPSLSVTDVTASGLHITEELQTLSPYLLRPPAASFSLPPGMLSLRDSKMDIGTAYGDIRVEGDLTVSPAGPNNQRAIQASIRARQYQLSFNTNWNGMLYEDGRIQMDTILNDGRINAGPLRLSRLNGWMSFRTEEQAASFSGQMDAGSGSFSKLPLQNISLAFGTHNTDLNLIFRAGVSGYPDIALSADFDKTGQQTRFSSLLETSDTGALFHFLSHMGQKAPPPEALLQSGITRLENHYLYERRFPGGPLPFSLQAFAGPDRILNGQYLIYTDSGDIRGTVETSEPIAQGLKTTLSLPEDNVTGRYLRLESSLKQIVGESRDTRRNQK